MIPEITRLSSTRGTPRGLFGKSGFKRANWASDSQKWWSEIANSQHFAGAPHIAGRTGILFMGPEPNILKREERCRPQNASRVFEVEGKRGKVYDEAVCNKQVKLKRPWARSR
jgi:hypothetical protein